MCQNHFHQNMLSQYRTLKRDPNLKILPIRKICSFDQNYWKQNRGQQSKVFALTTALFIYIRDSIWHKNPTGRIIFRTQQTMGLIENVNFSLKIALQVHASRQRENCIPYTSQCQKDLGKHFFSQRSDKIEELFNVYTVEGMHGCLKRKVRNKRLFSRIKFHSFFACVLHAAPRRG